MSFTGRNPPPDVIAKVIHYCDHCGRGSSAGPCPSHDIESDPFSEATAEQLRAMPRDVRQRLTAQRDMTPGAPHPDPRLAASGWHASSHGTYVRRVPERDPEMEAG